MTYDDLSEYGEAAWLERMYEQSQRDQQRRLLATVTTEAEDAEALRHVAIIAAKADDAEDYTLRCFVGKEKVFYFEYPNALLPGHIYSHAGKDE